MNEVTKAVQLLERDSLLIIGVATFSVYYRDLYIREAHLHA